MKKFFLSLIASIMIFSSNVSARDYISIVGSSTVYPFATLVAEKLASEGMKAPVIESTGSGGGHKLFCAGIGVEHPDITNSSRAQKDKEFSLCQDSGVEDIIEVRVGNDGIAFAYSADYEWKNATGSSIDGGINLTKEEIWQAMARDNLNAPKTWNDIDARLPKVEISIMAPPPSSGTRDAFDSLVMKKGCVKDMLVADGDCEAYREDGHVIEGGENDELYVEHITKEQGAFGIFGYSFLANNEDKIAASKINGVEISMEGIQDYSYPIARPLFFYIKKAHVGVIPGLMDYVNEFVSEEATEGYLLDAGLVELSPADRAKVLDDIANLKNYK